MSLIYRICLNLTVCSSLQWDTWFCWAGKGRALLPEMASPCSASAGVARSSSWHGLCCRGLQTQGAAVSARPWAGLGIVSPAGCWFSSPELLHAGMLAAEPMKKYILKHPDFSLYLLVLRSYFRINEKKTNNILHPVKCLWYMWMLSSKQLGDISYWKLLSVQSWVCAEVFYGTVACACLRHMALGGGWHFPLFRA